VDGCTAEHGEHCKIYTVTLFLLSDIIDSFDKQTCFRERFA